MEPVGNSARLPIGGHRGGVDARTLDFTGGPVASGDGGRSFEKSAPCLPCSLFSTRKCRTVVVRLAALRIVDHDVIVVNVVIDNNT